MPLVTRTTPSLAAGGAASAALLAALGPVLTGARTLCRRLLRCREPVGQDRPQGRPAASRPARPTAWRGSEPPPSAPATEDPHAARSVRPAEGCRARTPPAPEVTEAEVEALLARARPGWRLMHFAEVRSAEEVPLPVPPPFRVLRIEVAHGPLRRTLFAAGGRIVAERR